MAIATSQLDASYFVLDLPDVRWTGAQAGKRVRVVITPQNGQAVEFSESYVADTDGAVTLRGLAELVEPYVRPCPTPLRQDLVTGAGVWLATVVRAAVTVQLYKTGNATIQPTFHTYAYYASRRTTAKPGATAMWLTRYTERTIIPAQPITLSVLLQGALSARLLVEGLQTDGTLATATVAPDFSAADGSSTANAPAYAAVVHYSLEQVASLAAVGQVKRITAELLRSGTVVDSVTFHVDYSHHAQQRIVAFTNCYGMLETEAFTGIDDLTTEMDAEFSWMEREYQKTSTREVTQHRLAARFTSDTRRDSLRDITASPEVYLIHEDGISCWEKVTVTAFEMTDHKPRTAPQTAYLTLRPAAMHQEEVARRGNTDSGHTRHRIFDYTHDYTFN
ncbi:MAG: hypothetical protein J5486_04230 [Bacteroidaceae bacterium]|nr:hypothetical protein [Bacteroidaceae bacterium]